MRVEVEEDVGIRGWETKNGLNLLKYILLVRQGQIPITDAS